MHIKREKARENARDLSAAFGNAIEQKMLEAVLGSSCCNRIGL
jgi:hypothetical protein